MKLIYRLKEFQNSFFSFILAILIYMFVFSKVDFNKLISTLKLVNLPLFFLAFFFFYLSILLKGLRWFFLIKNLKIRIKVRYVIIYYFLAMFFNSLTPGKSGDIYKTYLIKNKTHAPFSLILSTVFIERILDLISLVSLTIISGWFIFKTNFPENITIILKFAVLFVLFLCMGTFFFLKFNQKLFIFKKYFWIKKFFINFESGLKALDSKKFLFFLCLSFLAWLMEGLVIYFIFYSLRMECKIFFSIFVGLSSALLTGLPLTPAGLGIVEGGLLFFLKFFHIPSVYSYTIILLYRSITYLSLIIWGSFVYFFISFPFVILEKKN